MKNTTQPPKGATASRTASVIEIAGLYDVNQETGSLSAYPDTITHAYVQASGSNHHDVVFFDEDGDVVVIQERPHHRIKEALSGENGYDIVVRGGE